MNDRNIILIVDGSYLAHKAFYATKEMGLKNSQGFPTGVIYTFLKTIKR